MPPEGRDQMGGGYAAGGGVNNRVRVVVGAGSWVSARVHSGLVTQAEVLLLEIIPIEACFVLAGSGRVRVVDCSLHCSSR